MTPSEIPYSIRWRNAQGHAGKLGVSTTNSCTGCRFCVFETNCMDRGVEIKPAEILRAFFVNQLPLVTASDMSGHGN